MADIKKPHAMRLSANPLFLTDPELRKAIELLFFAYRNFIQEPDQMLAELGLGRAHHRVLYFVGRYPDMPVANLLEILAITKQSLSRVLGDLVDAGYVMQQQGQRDKRQRLLRLTEKGEILESQLSAMQRKRIAAAYKDAGGQAVDGFKKVMLALLDDPQDRARFNED
ncbi:MAG: MarR family winged helix-turn-helix transcriptional regulator [Alphaproteobacteria bacterium]